MIFESTVCCLVSFACYCIHDNVLDVHIFIFPHSHFHTTKQGQLPMDLAREAGHHGIVMYLQQRTRGGVALAEEYKARRLGVGLREQTLTTTMQQRVGRETIMSSDEEEEEEVSGTAKARGEGNGEELVAVVVAKTPSELDAEEDERNMQFLLHPLCGECNQVSWSTRHRLLNKETFGTLDRTKKLCPGYDPSTHDCLVCRYCGHSRGRHHTDPVVIAKIKLRRKELRKVMKAWVKETKKNQLKRAVVDVV